MPRPPDVALRGTGALLALFALEGGLLLAAAGAYRITGDWDTAPDRAIAALAGGGTFALACAAALLRLWQRADQPGRRTLRLALSANLLVVALLGAAAEMALRVLARETSDGIAIGPAVLPPTWAETRARNGRLIREAGRLGEWWDTFFVADPLLGWTAGPDRKSHDGLYYTSAEGIRSPGPGISFTAQPRKRRIALIGDSYTFSMDVPWEDSWAHHLQLQAGSDTQVLNFGIDGYGIDQAYLRYRRDVRPWRPDVVIFGLVQHDLTRTLAVYPFLSFGWGFPFAKPRFRLTGDGVELLNTPLISPQEIVAQLRLAHLPYVEYDRGYQTSDWRWRHDSAPLIVRLFQTAIRRLPPPDVRVSEATATAISGRLLRQFRAEALREGTVPYIVYFPSRGAGDFDNEARHRANPARAMLAEYIGDYIDLTTCVTAVPPAQRLVPGRVHYTGMANAAVARCIWSQMRARDRNGAGGGT